MNLDEIIPNVDMSQSTTLMGMIMEINHLRQQLVVAKARIIALEARIAKTEFPVTYVLNATYEADALGFQILKELEIAL